MVSKQKTILQAAQQAFATYGFRKTSMDDIARGAGMSRPALYLQYKNKDDIFRSLVRSFYEDAAVAVQKALAGEGSVPQVLAAAFAAQTGKVLEAILTSPHGLELLDIGTTTSADVVETGEQKLIAAYSVWLSDQARAGHIYLNSPAEEVASTFTAALHGIKSGATSYATYSAQVAQLGTLIGAGLTVKV